MVFVVLVFCLWSAYCCFRIAGNYLPATSWQQVVFGTNEYLIALGPFALLSLLLLVIIDHVSNCAEALGADGMAQVNIGSAQAFGSFANAVKVRARLSVLRLFACC